MPFIIDRRTLLRGVAGAGATVALPLPRLGGMLNGNGNAYADGTALPRRFGTWIFGNGRGADASKWDPAGAGGTGDSWQLSDLLSPLLPVKSHLAVVTGLEMFYSDQISASVHVRGATNALTGGTVTASDGVNPTPQLPSIDQVIAGGPAYQGTPIRSLQVGVCTAGPGFNDCSALQHISYSGPNSPNRAVTNPRTVFERLFMPGLPTTSQGLIQAKKRWNARRSVLDVVAADARRLQMSLGAEDRVRLDRHCDGIRLLEKEILAFSEQSVSLCPTANAADFPDRNGNDECPPELDDIMSNLIVLALACDRTRVFSYEFTKPSSSPVYRNLGQENEFHNFYCHDEPYPQPGVRKGVLYATGQLSKFLQKLKNTPDGAGSLLDNSCIYTTSDLGNGQSHSTGNMPVLIAGKAGGALRGNVHAPMTGNISKALFTLANAMGMPVTSFGKDGALVKDGVGAIVA